jgi:hypothetical protein
MKKPNSDQLGTAIEWLRNNEGDGPEVERRFTWQNKV